MISMKCDKKKKKNNEPSVMSSDNDYPYGLNVNLGKEPLKKLGLKSSDFDAGAKGELKATFEVVGIRTSAGNSGDGEEVSIQITGLELEGAKKAKGSDYFDQQKEGPGGGDTQ